MGEDLRSYPRFWCALVEGNDVLIVYLGLLLCKTLSSICFLLNESSLSSKTLPHAPAVPLWTHSCHEVPWREGYRCRELRCSGGRQSNWRLSELNLAAFNLFELFQIVIGKGSNFGNRRGLFVGWLHRGLLGVALIVLLNSIAAKLRCISPTCVIRALAHCKVFNWTHSRARGHTLAVKSELLLYLFRRDGHFGQVAGALWIIA
jgi:hypothetical protein